MWGLLAVPRHTGTTKSGIALLDANEFLDIVSILATCSVSSDHTT